MRYIQATNFYRAQVVALCEKNKIKVPDMGMILVAVDDDGIVHGVAALKLAYQFEPLIADEPVIAMRLASMIEGSAITTGAESILTLVDGNKEDNIDVFTKFGFKVTDVGFTVLEKSLVNKDK